MVQPLCGSCNLISFSSFVGQETSFPTITCCAVIVGGFWLGVDQENVAGNYLGTPVHVLMVSHSIIGAIK
jgi:GDP-fucose transporter C1